jgi:transmembrane sensor
VRLASDAASEADWLDFESWLAASPAHLRAYEAVEALWSELDAVARPSTPIAFGRAPPRRRMAGWIAALAACVVAAVGVALATRQPAAPPAVYETARGQRRTVELADGSRLTLNGATRVAVRLSRGEREVDLARGEAAFDVAKDPRRPFVIAVGERQVRVVGTEFNILRDGRTMTLTVRRGAVEVRSAPEPASALIARLGAGERLVHHPGSAPDQVAAADPATAFAWTEGRLIFRNERLEDVAKVLNRYLETPLMVADDVRDVRVTAVLALDDEAVMLGRLAEFLPIKVAREPGVVRVERR